MTHSLDDLVHRARLVAYLRNLSDREVSSLARNLPWHGSPGAREAFRIDQIWRRDVRREQPKENA